MVQEVPSEQGTVETKLEVPKLAPEEEKRQAEVEQVKNEFQDDSFLDKKEGVDSFQSDIHSSLQKEFPIIGLENMGSLSDRSLMDQYIQLEDTEKYMKQVRADVLIRRLNEHLELLQISSAERGSRRDPTFEQLSTLRDEMQNGRFEEFRSIVLKSIAEAKQKVEPELIKRGLTEKLKERKQIRERSRVEPIKDIPQDSELGPEGRKKLIQFEKDFHYLASTRGITGPKSLEEAVQTFNAMTQRANDLIDYCTSKKLDAVQKQAGASLARKYLNIIFIQKENTPPFEDWVKRQAS